MANFENCCKSPSNALWTATSSLQRKNETRMGYLHACTVHLCKSLQIFTIFYPFLVDWNLAILTLLGFFVSISTCRCTLYSSRHVALFISMLCQSFAIGFSVFSSKASRTGRHGGRSCCQVDADHGLFESARRHAGVLCVGSSEGSWKGWGCSKLW